MWRWIGAVESREGAGLTSLELRGFARGGRQLLGGDDVPFEEIEELCLLVWRKDALGYGAEGETRDDGENCLTFSPAGEGRPLGDAIAYAFGATTKLSSSIVR
jgi:hypothetical protein